jgi:hypothetical protein
MRKLLVVAVLAGCAHIKGSDALAQLHPGMSKAEVVQLCGVPYATSMHDGEETLTYRLKPPVTVKLHDGAVTEYGPTADFEPPDTTQKVDVTLRRSWPWSR